MSVAAGRPPSTLGRSGAGRVRAADRAATIALWAIAILVISVLIAIIAHFVIASIGVISLSFLTSAPSDSGLGGIGPLIWNSLYILVLTLIFTVPPGILGGIYMAEYAREGRVTEAIRFCQELTSAVPSIVVGLFGLAFFVGVTGWGFSALAGALALTVFNLPLLSRLTEQAIRAVPADERAASLAVGASKWQTIRHVVVPLALPGIVTGLILTSGRIFGEAAALIFTAGLATPTSYDFSNVSLTDPASPWSPLRPATTLSVYIWKLNSEGLSPFVREIADGSATVLVFMVLIFNVAARFVSRALQQRMAGS
jgi:phosphate transport system permease protein